MKPEHQEFFAELREMVRDFGSAPTLAEMPRRRLEDKGIDGPTAAHVIEETHVPFNFAHLTFTTGSSAFQNIVGVTYAELPLKVEAALKALRMSKVSKGDKILFCYPPLVNVFTKKALEEIGVQWFFLERSSRDAFLTALYFEKPDVVMGESVFIRVALEDAVKLGVARWLPKIKSVMVAGAPMDTEMPGVTKEVLGADVFDLYGCQEFGWLTVNGVPLRDDLSLVPSALGEEYREVVVGGLPMGDSFPVTDASHMLSPEGKIITYRRKRTRPDYEVVVRETSLSSIDTLERAARTILRIKSRVVKVHPQVKLGSNRTVLWLKPSLEPIEAGERIVICGPEKTQCFDALTKAQIEYQENAVKDPAWIKRS